jgi:hypothetical protein
MRRFGFIRAVYVPCWCFRMGSCTGVEMAGIKSGHLYQDISTSPCQELLNCGHTVCSTVPRMA